MTRTSLRIPILCSLAAVAAAGALPARAQLRPEEVLVVANRRSAESRALAARYLEARGISAKNLLLLEMSEEHTVSRRHYDAHILLPVREALLERDDIRCLCLVWGVPVRVAGPEPPRGSAAAAWRAAVADTQEQLAVAVAVTPLIGEAVPEGAYDSPAELADAMGPALQELQRLPSLRLLHQQLPRLLEAAEKRIAALPPDTQRIARGHMELIRRELLGLRARIADEDARRAYRQIQSEIARIHARDGSARAVRKLVDLTAEADGLLAAHDMALERLSAGPDDKADASVDSELAMALAAHYDLPGSQPNPLYHKHEGPTGRILMTARLDGPSAPDIRRALRGALEAEKDGLDGTAYIDAGGHSRGAAYDENLRELAEILSGRTRLKIRLDERRDVFSRNSAPDAALYVGWYAPRRYVPAFIWKPGAVGWHLSSFEAAHLRDPDSREWCVKMIQSGVSATIGAVDEPFLSAFPLPQDFYRLLLTGRYTLAECYWRTVPHASWRLTLIGDPLYRPFRANPQLDPSDLPEGLAPPKR